MKRTGLYMAVSLLLTAVLSAGCGGGGGGGNGGGSSSKAITAFGFTSPAATGTVNESDKTISVTVPYSTDTTALAATFTTTGTSVVVGGTVQVSGVTVNNFTFPVVYTVNAADGSSQNYTVTVTVAYGSAKDITSFSILGFAGRINEDAKTISVNLPSGTDVTAQAATFTTTGKVVAVGGTTQVSGVTQNNFTSPVVYTVTAFDDSNVDYTVTVAALLGTPITPAVPPITSFGQTRASNDPNPINSLDEYYSENFPGQANVWDISNDFSLFDGGDLQFWYALSLYFDTISFGDPGIAYGDLTFSGPLMGTAQGVKVAAVSDGVSTGVTTTGTYSAFLNETSDSRLMQTLNLSNATGTITLTWEDSVNLYEGFFNFPLYEPSYRVVIRDIGGAELEELYKTNAMESGGTHTANLTAYRGQNVVLSFEERSASIIGFLTMIDSVSVIDSGTATEHVTNGDFETGDLTGWTTNSPAEVQNMTSSAENHNGLDVKRSFYTVPNKLWGRWVDVFENNTGSAITTTLDYETVLYSDGTAIIYDTPLTDQKAITVWEGTKTARDVGMVFGNADLVEYTSVTDLNMITPDGSDTIDVYYTITVPPGGRVAIVNFIILGTYDTSLNAMGVSARATEIDEEAKNIVDNFWTDMQYRNGMTQQQLDAIKNF